MGRVRSLASFGLRLRNLALAVALFSGPGCASIERLLQRANPDSGRELVLEQRWVRSTIAQDYLGSLRTHRMSPVFFGDLVIQGNAIDGIVAFDRKTGSQVWRLDVDQGVEGGAAIDSGRLYFGASDGNFYCVNAEDGRIEWTFPVRAETLAAPTVLGGVVYFQTGADILFALDAATGRQVWLYNRQTATNLSVRASTRPVIDGDLVFAGFSDGFLVAVSRQSGALKWDRKLGLNRRFNDVDSTPVIDGEMIFVSSYDGALYALNKQSGETVWQFDQGGYTAVTLGTGDVLYYATSSGAVVALEKSSGRQIWSVAVEGGGVATQPLLHQGFLIYGESSKSLVVAEARTGSRLAAFAPGRGILAMPTAPDPKRGEIFFFSNGANLFAMKVGFQPRSARLPWQ